MNRLRSVVAAAVLVVGSAATWSGGTVAATASPSAAKVRVIVLLKSPAGRIGSTRQARAAHMAVLARGQQSAIAQIRSTGGRVGYRYSLINGFAATVTAADEQILLRRSDVAAVLPDTYVRLPQPSALRAARRHPAATSTTVAPAPTKPNTIPARPQVLPAIDPTVCPTDPSKPLLEPEALSLLRVDSATPSEPSASDYSDGAGVRVGVIANAFDPTNPDMTRADGTPVITSYKDFAGTGTTAPADASEAMGDSAAIAAQGNRTYDLSAFGAVPAGCTIRIRGVAPGADVIALKALDGRGYYSSSVTEAIDYAVTVAHVNVLNESLAGDAYPDNGDDPVSLADAAAVAAGVTVTSASGDAGRNSTIGAPSSTRLGAAGIISMGASTQLRATKQFGLYPAASRQIYSGNIADFSTDGIAQTGRVIDALAPGSRDWSLCTNESSRYLDCPNFPAGASGLQLFGGTSEAAPLAAGIAALVIQRYRNTHHGSSPSPQLVKQILTSTADDLGAPAAEQGAGQLDALRAVELAAAVHGGQDANGTRDVAVAPTTRSITVEAGETTRTSLQVDNPSGTVHHLIIARRAPALSGTARESTTVASNYASVTFPVRAGTDRISVLADLAAQGGDYPQADLIDPNGNIANTSAAEGPTDTVTLEADHPLPGNWQLAIYTSAYDGPVAVTARSYRNVTVALAQVSVAALSKRRVSLPVTSGPTAGDAVPAYTISDARTRTVLTSVPIVIRTPVRLFAGQGRFRGELNGGNGRGGDLSGAAQFLVRVRRGTPALRIALRVASSTARVDGYLTSPSGNALDETSSTPSGDASSGASGGEVDLTAVAPQPGTWRIAVGLNGPTDGVAGEIPYQGRVSTTPAPISAHGLPTSPQSLLAPGQRRTAAVHVVNTSSVPHTYVIDARLAGYAPAALTGDTSVQFSAANELPVATALVPPQTRALSATMTADQPLAGTLTPEEISFPASNGDPEVYQVSPSGRVDISLRAAELQNGPWLELPVPAGPFGVVGTGTVTVQLQTSALTRPFDPAVTSGTGDPWPATVGDPQTVTPLTVPAHHSADIPVTITADASSGSTVRGTLFVDTWDPSTRVSGELAALPYIYRIG